MFRSELTVTHLIGTSSYRTKEPLIYEGSLKFIVPVGFIFDGASVPKFLTNILPRSGARYDRAACLHDWLYASHLADRKTADDLFLEAMRSDGVNKFKSWIMYRTVRVFGRKAYQKISDKDAKKLIETLGGEKC